ncbi:MAG: hypothetical protein SAL07_25535 [Oscillatoria sp. PMC 1051.18]|nr:hypothetical protein [Oscillatoria sp. PMC 1050.18]MEC5033271.1 hypothetical protein [Oscillatoria sp. PMC 1051.18]
MEYTREDYQLILSVIVSAWEREIYTPKGINAAFATYGHNFYSYEEWMKRLVLFQDYIKELNLEKEPIDVAVEEIDSEEHY